MDELDLHVAPLLLGDGICVLEQGVQLELLTRATRERLPIFATPQAG